MECSPNHRWRRWVNGGHSRSFSGFTLIEIMVALLISAFLLAGVISIALSNRQSYQTKESMSRLQENLRLLPDILRKPISMAESLHPASGVDRIIVLYTGGGDMVNCLGNPITAGPVVNHFYVRNNALYCGVTYPATPGSEQPLVDGVASMAVQYGIDTTHQGQVERYVDAPNDWNEVISARITLQLLDPTLARQPEVVLTVAMRPRLLSRLP